MVDNPPAFPCETNGNANGFQSGAALWTYPGMTLRDWFAGQALACVYKRFLPDSDASLDDLALQAYAIADAMLAERMVTE